MFNRNFVELWKLPPELASAGAAEPVSLAVATQMEEPAGFIAHVKYLYPHVDIQSYTELPVAAISASTVPGRSSGLLPRSSRYSMRPMISAAIRSTDACIGIVPYRADIVSFVTMMMKADLAPYRVKSDGRDRFPLYIDALDIRTR